MTEIGEGFSTIVTLSSQFIEFTAPTGETRKITNVYVKSPLDGSPKNDGTYVSPANGAEARWDDGTHHGSGEGIPVVGANVSAGNSNKIQTLQPIYITDSIGLYVGNGDTSNKDVIIQGVRVA